MAGCETTTPENALKWNEGTMQSRQMQSRYFETADEKLIDLKIQDYKIVDDFHSSFLVLDHIHHAVEI